MKYIKEFKTTAEYEEYIDDVNRPYYPNSSLTDDSMRVHNKGMLAVAFTGTNPDSAGVFKLRKRGLNFEYSTNLGDSWEELPDQTAIEVGYKQTILVHGKNTTFSTQAIQVQFYDCHNVLIGGNVMGLLDYTQPLYTIPTAYCFYNLFAELDPTCSLVDLYLPATELKPHCYDSMFADCTGITEAPKLPAYHLETGCYQGMFANCSKLVEAPYLVAKTVPTYAYRNMFNGCSLVNEIFCKAEEFETDACTNWLAGVSTMGNFHKKENATFPSGAIPASWQILPDLGA